MNVTQKSFEVCISVIDFFLEYQIWYKIKIGKIFDMKDMILVVRAVVGQKHVGVIYCTVIFRIPPFIEFFFIIILYFLLYRRILQKQIEVSDGCNLAHYSSSTVKTTEYNINYILQEN